MSKDEAADGTDALLLDVPQALRHCGPMGRTLFLAKVRSGEIPSVRVNRRRFFRGADLRLWADSLVATKSDEGRS